MVTIDSYVSWLLSSFKSVKVWFILMLEYIDYVLLYILYLRFNLIRFSGNCEKWKEQIQPSTQDNCHAAVKWASTLKASGNTCTLEALKVKIYCVQPFCN